MEMEELREVLEAEFTYPIDHAAVVERLGERELRARESGTTETVAAIIGAVGEDEYASADELWTTIVGNVGDEFIGRKFYDDRGGNPPEIGSPSGDDSDRSL